MKYKKYSSYKDSGVEWLGEIPESWDARRLGFYFKERREKVSDKVFSPLSVTKNGIVLQLENAAKSDDGDNRKKVCKGDFVINSRSDRKGSSGLSQLDGSVSLINTVIEPKNINENYIHYLLKSQPFQEEYYRYGKGIVADLWSTNYSEMKNIIISSPTLKEQQQIANFLDKATAKIDTLIEKQTKQIELLKEKRQAVISHAVTKGINPNVPMKDSGVEWLGEISEHWKISPLRHLGQLQNGVSKGSDYFGSGYPFINYGDIYNNDIIPSQINGLAQSSLEDRITYSVKKGDIFFTRTSETIDDIGMASTCLQTIPNATFSGFTIRFRQFKEVLLASFSRYQFRSGYSQSFFVKEMNLVTRASLGQDLLKRLHTVIPPLEEQQQIVNYLDEKTSKIDTLIEKSKKSIELLKEKRTALISAAVTGKIDVREFE